MLVITWRTALQNVDVYKRQEYIDEVLDIQNDDAIKAENMEETMRIQREESQRAQRLPVSYTHLVLLNQTIWQ